MNELYDLAADPYEEHNLITAPAAETLLKTMQRELERLTRASAGVAQRDSASPQPPALRRPLD